MEWANRHRLCTSAGASNEARARSASANSECAALPAARQAVDRATPNWSPSSAVLYHPTSTPPPARASVGGWPGSAPKPTVGLRGAHTFPGAEPIEVGLGFGDHGRLEWQPPDRIGRVVNRPAEQPGTSGGPSIGDARASGRDRATLSSFVTTRVSPSRNAANAFANGQHLPPDGPTANDTGWGGSTSDSRATDP